MIVYGGPDEDAPTAVALGRIREAMAQGDATGALVECGVLEAAVLDALQPDEDAPSPARDALRALSLAAGSAFAGRDADLEAPLHAVTRLSLPPRLRLRTPEGYAWYGLDPRTYADAAARFLADEPAPDVVCVGLRSIGTSLSAVVTAVLAAAGRRVASFALRPRGHPFDRHLALSRALRGALVARRHAFFLIVDEGPGLSGSSLTGTARDLAVLGVPDDRIGLVPAHDPDPAAFVNAAARDRWRRHRRFTAPFDHGRHLGLDGDVVDVTGGGWRAHLCPDGAAPLVHPHHERRKLLVRRPDGDRLVKFGGLGRFGAATLHRAERLAAAGFGPPVEGLFDGHLVYRLVRGTPQLRGPPPEDLVRHAGRYLAVRRWWTADRPVPFDALLEMIVRNTRAVLGDAWARRACRLSAFRPMALDAGTVEIDGRLLPHEWLRTAEGWLKTDGTDHCCDHFFPGTQDIAWDVAGFAIEHQLDDPAPLLAAFGPDAAGIRRRLPLYKAAYLAFRLGYAALAADTLPGDDARRWADARRRYAGRLRATLTAVPGAVS